MLRGRYAYSPGAYHINWFSLFNAIAWNIALGSPVILFAKTLNASQTMLGLIAALMPLLVVFQIPAAHLLPRYGYRRFILAGWGTRTFFIFGLAVVPLLSFLPVAGRLWLAILCLFAFNLIRGVTSGAWMPWITEIIPDDLRGRFLCRDQIFTQLGCLLAIAFASLVLSGKARPWQFTVTFLISGVGQAVSLLFLKRVPDVTAPEKLARSGHRVPWRQMLFYGPFLRIIVFHLVYVVVVGGLSVFTVAYLHDVAKCADSTILYLQAVLVLGAVSSLTWVGPMMDRIGSKPVLRACIVLFVVVLAGWWLIAGRVANASVWTVAALNLLNGAGSIWFSVAISRLSMATMPAMGRNHFFALFTVITSLGWGLAPIGWGVFLDLAAGFHGRTGPLHWSGYSIYFLIAMTLGLATLALVSILREERPGRVVDAPGLPLPSTRPSPL